MQFSTNYTHIHGSYVVMKIARVPMLSLFEDDLSVPCGSSLHRGTVFLLSFFFLGSGMGDLFINESHIYKFILHCTSMYICLDS